MSGGGDIGEGCGICDVGLVFGIADATGTAMEVNGGGVIRAEGRSKRRNKNVSEVGENYKEAGEGKELGKKGQ